MGARRRRRPKRKQGLEALSNLEIVLELLVELVRIVLRRLEYDVDAEIRRILVLLRRMYREMRQRGRLCEKCYEEVINTILKLETLLEEREYERALRKWAI